MLSTGAFTLHFFFGHASYCLVLLPSDLLLFACSYSKYCCFLAWLSLPLGFGQPVQPERVHLGGADKVFIEDLGLAVAQQENLLAGRKIKLFFRIRSFDAPPAFGTDV